MSAFSRCQASQCKRHLVREPQQRSRRPCHRLLKLIPRAQAEVESDVDPVTGTTYQNPEVRLPKASLSVEAGGVTWAYRRADPEDGSDTAGKEPVLMLHGLGSHSFCYRDLMRLLAAGGYTSYAPDWPGHGASSKPQSGFAYNEDAYIDALDAFVKEIGLAGKPYSVIVHGFVLGQYGMLWALKNKDDIKNLVIMGVPLGKKTSLRPELAAYKSRMPFMKRNADSKFAGDMYAANGLAYVMQYEDAQIYDRPYQEDSGANEAVYKTMGGVDWKALLQRVDSGYERWKVPTAVLYGNKDTLLDVKDAVDWLDTKRTTMKLTSLQGKLGHMPQEDFADAISPLIMDFLAGEDISLKDGLVRFKKKAYEGAPETESVTGDY